MQYFKQDKMSHEKNKQKQIKQGNKGNTKL